MDSRHAHIVKMLRLIAHNARSQQSFLSDGNIAGPRGNNKNGALANNC